MNARFWMRWMDADPWTAWLKRHAPAMVLAARQWVSDHALAEDIAQDGIISFWPLRHHARDPLALLYICVKRAALQWHRQSTRRHRREQKIAREESYEAMFTSPLHDEDRRRQIEAALQQLPIEQREVLVMKIWIGLSFPQIASALDIPSDTAASRYRYALAKLRTLLNQEALL